MKGIEFLLVVWEVIVLLLSYICRVFGKFMCWSGKKVMGGIGLFVVLLLFM